MKLIKYLKYLCGIIAVLVITFYLLGFMRPNIAYDCEVWVDKPLAESWNVLQDEDKLADWLMGFQKVEHISGEPGTVGAVSLIYFVVDEQEMTVKETITKVIPNESISMQFESEFMAMDYQLQMAFVDGKTKIKSSIDAKGNEMFSRSMMAIMGSSIKTEEETNLANLKKTIEANTKQYGARDQETAKNELQNRK